jgi:hypothetical protein
MITRVPTSHFVFWLHTCLPIHWTNTRTGNLQSKCPMFLLQSVIHWVLLTGCCLRYLYTAVINTQNHQCKSLILAYGFRGFCLRSPGFTVWGPKTRQVIVSGRTQGKKELPTSRQSWRKERDKKGLHSSISFKGLKNQFTQRGLLIKSSISS